MKRAVLASLVVILLAGAVLAPMAVAKKRVISSDNPFFRPQVDLWPYIVQYRQAVGGPFWTSTENPLGLDDVKFLYLLGMNTQGLAQLAEFIAEKGEIIDLETLTQVSFFGSARTLFKILLFWSFPDEQKLAEAGFFKVEQPRWWENVP